MEKSRPDQVNPAPVLVKACQGQEHPGFEDVLDRSLDTVGWRVRLPVERILTWVGSQPHLLLEVASGLGNLTSLNLGLGGYGGIVV